MSWIRIAVITLVGLAVCTLAIVFVLTAGDGRSFLEDEHVAIGRDRDGIYFAVCEPSLIEAIEVRASEDPDSPVVWSATSGGAGSGIVHTGDPGSYSAAGRASVFDADRTRSVSKLDLLEEAGPFHLLVFNPKALADGEVIDGGGHVLSARRWQSRCNDD